MAGTILVFSECRDGEFKRSTLETLGAARRIADGCGGSVDTVALGPQASAATATLAARGADRVWACDDACLDVYQARAYVATLAAACEESGAGLVLLPASMMGNDISTRLAAQR